MHTLRRQTILVTGVSRGIGHAVCRALLEEGASVVGLSRQAQEISHLGANYHPVAIDLSDTKQLPQLLKPVVKKIPTLAGVVSNAGVGFFNNLEEFSYAQIEEALQINLLSHLFLARAFLPSMKKRGRGTFIFMGSEAAQRGGKQGSLYAAAKFGLRGFAQSLREECAPHGVRIGIINPGMVRTPFFDNLNFEPGEHTENALTPEDVAKTVVLMLNAEQTAVIDEINLTPRVKKILHKKSSKKSST